MERKARRTRGPDTADDGTPAFPAPARHLTPSARTVLDGLLLALLGRRRLLVLTGGADERPGVAGAAAARAADDGTLILPAVARPGAGVEDLIRQGGAAAFAPHAAPADFEELVAALDARLDFAGSGVLAVEEAHRLSPATIADLVELSREETTHGRFLQILLSGDAALEHTLSRPGLDRAVRDLGVIYRLDTPAAPPHRPALPAAVTLAMDDDDDRAEPMVFPTATPLVRARRSSAGAWATGMVLTAAAVAGFALSLPDGPWKDRLTSTAAALPATASGWAGDLWTRTAALWETLSEGDVPLDAERVVALAIPAPETPPPTAPATAQSGAAQSGAELPPAVHPAPVHPAAPQPTPHQPAPVFTPLTTPAPPPAPETAPSAAVAEPPAPAPDPVRQQRLQALEEVARQQMAAKRLTTPPGDNALETVQQMQAEIPDTPVARELLEAMADTYRRWGMLAERTGNWDDARRFYERGLRVLPGEPTLVGLLRAVEERSGRPAPVAGQTGGATTGQPAMMTATNGPPPAHRMNGTDYGRLWP